MSIDGDVEANDPEDLEIAFYLFVERIVLVEALVKESGEWMVLHGLY